MKTVTFGFSKPRKWKPFSWLIMKAYNIPYSHSYIKIYSETYNRHLVYQASSTMVNFMNMKSFDEHAVVVYETEIQITQEQRSKIMQFAIDTCGKPYGTKEILGLAWVRINSWLGRDVKNPLSTDDATLICSELTSIVLRDCLSIELSKDPDDMTPLDVYLTLSRISQNNTMDNNT